jgi:hypothetical protein
VQLALVIPRGTARNRPAQAQSHTAFAIASGNWNQRRRPVETMQLTTSRPSMGIGKR